MRKLTLLTLTVVLIGARVYAQEQPVVHPEQNTIYVGADGRYETTPDTALVQFNIAAQDDTAKAAYARASNAADQVRQILRSNGIDPKQAELGFFSIQQVVDWRSPKQKVVAYQVNSSVVLKLSDFAKIAPIVQQISEMDVTANQSVSYTLENIDAAKQKAVADAYRHAHDSAETVARAGERTLTGLLYSSVDTFEQVRVLAQPGQRAMARMGAMAPEQAPTAEFSPQKIVVTAHVNAMFGMK